MNMTHTGTENRIGALLMHWLWSNGNNMEICIATNSIQVFIISNIFEKYSAQLNRLTRHEWLIHNSHEKITLVQLPVIIFISRMSRVIFLRLRVMCSFHKNTIGPYAAPPNMEGYEPPVAGDQKKNYPTQSTPIMPPGGGGYASAGYPSAGYPPPGYPPATGFAPAPAFQHVAEDEPIVKGLDFNTETIRKGFIRKVYSILSVMWFASLSRANRGSC